MRICRKSPVRPPVHHAQSIRAATTAYCARYSERGGSPSASPSTIRLLVTVKGKFSSCLQRGRELRPIPLRPPPLPVSFRAQSSIRRGSFCPPNPLTKTCQIKCEINRPDRDMRSAPADLWGRIETKLVEIQNALGISALPVCSIKSVWLRERPPENKPPLESGG